MSVDECTSLGNEAGGFAVEVFDTHAHAVEEAQFMNELGAPGPTAELVGENWLVSTDPKLLSVFESVLGGQVVSGTE